MSLQGLDSVCGSRGGLVQYALPYRQFIRTKNEDEREPWTQLWATLKESKKKKRNDSRFGTMAFMFFDRKIVKDNCVCVHVCERGRDGVLLVVITVNRVSVESLQSIAWQYWASAHTHLRLYG